MIWNAPVFRTVRHKLPFKPQFIKFCSWQLQCVKTDFGIKKYGNVFDGDCGDATQIGSLVYFRFLTTVPQV